LDAVTTCVELGEMARMISWCASVTLCLHSAPRKTRSERSCEPVTTSPVGSTATVTACAPASSVCRSWPEAASQTFAVPSQDPVTRFAPHSAREHTGPPWPLYCTRGSPSELTRMAVLSLEPE